MGGVVVEYGVELGEEASVTRDGVVIQVRVAEELWH
jgi:hypothetical protein